MVNSAAEARRHAAAVKIGSVYDLEYAARPWFGLQAAKSYQIFARGELFLTVCIDGCDRQCLWSANNLYLCDRALGAHDGTLLKRCSASRKM